MPASVAGYTTCRPRASRCRTGPVRPRSVLRSARRSPPRPPKIHPRHLPRRAFYTAPRTRPRRVGCRPADQRDWLHGPSRRERTGSQRGRRWRKRLDLHRQGCPPAWTPYPKHAARGRTPPGCPRVGVAVPPTPEVGRQVYSGLRSAPLAVGGVRGRVLLARLPASLSRTVQGPERRQMGAQARRQPCSGHTQ